MARRWGIDTELQLMGEDGLARMNILVIDVGGSHVKFMMNAKGEERKMVSGPGLTAQMMVEGVKKLVAGWQFEAISLGFPGPVLHGRLEELPPGMQRGDNRNAFVGGVRLWEQDKSTASNQSRGA